LAGDVEASRLVSGLDDAFALVAGRFRRPPPHSKWLGTAFTRLPDTAAMRSSLAAAIAATRYRDREDHLCRAYEAAAGLHNRLGLTKPLDTRTRPFYDRPYQVLDASRFTAVLLEIIADPHIRQLPVVGAIDQYVDNTDAAGNIPFLRAAAQAAAGSVPDL
jgi:hypothetical protein